MKKKWLTRVIAVFLALLMLFSVLFGVVGSITAKAVSQSQIDSLKSQAGDLSRKKQEVQSQINSLQYQQSSALGKKAVLDEQIGITQDEINNINEQINTYEDLISAKVDEVKQDKEKEAAKLEQYKTRIRSMEENGTISYFAVIFDANSFVDLLSRIDFIGNVMEYDKNLYNQLQETRKATEQAEKDLEDDKADQVTQKSNLVSKQNDLAGQQKQATDLIASLDNSIGTYKTQLQQSEDDEAKVQSQINAAVAEQKRQEEAAAAAAKAAAADAAQNSNGNSGGSSGGSSGGNVKATGNFIWPAPSCHIVTSTYGMRLHPVYGVYKMHTGVDIGASYGANVIAADGGTVVLSSYDSGGYGNYIVISHGNGYTTLYAHMSTKKVSVGDKVSQGQVIGLVGATGDATGPHLHFEVSYNGSRVNPLNYFSGYTIED